MCRVHLEEKLMCSNEFNDSVIAYSILGVSYLVSQILYYTFWHDSRQITLQYLVDTTRLFIIPDNLRRFLFEPFLSTFPVANASFLSNRIS